MELSVLNKRLDTFIEEFDDNIIEVPKLFWIPEHYMPLGTPEHLEHINVMPETKTIIKLHELNYEKFYEWKELFNSYKELKGKIKGFKFKRKFKKFTNKKRIYLFHPLTRSHPIELKDWQEYS
jgi:hypothetical protein